MCLYELTEVLEADVAIEIFVHDEELFISSAIASSDNVHIP